jgi:hypothetical protein
VTLTGTYSDVGSQDTHTIDIDWGLGETPSLGVAVSGGSFTVTHQYLDDKPTGTLSDVYDIHVTLNDDDGGTATGMVQTTVNNVAPIVTNFASDTTFEDLAEENGLVTVTASFTDVGTQDTHSAVVDWGDGSPVEPATVDQGAGSGTVTATHAYASGGVFTVTVTLTDDDTGTAVASTLAVITGAGINDGVLQIVGTNHADHVSINKKQGVLKVHSDFFPEGDFRTFNTAEVELIRIWLSSGDDHASIAGNVDIPAILDGDGGNDHLKAGEGPAVLLGGSGDDELIGGKGRGLLIGGEGQDSLVGGPGDDILFGGTTDYDENDAALLALLAEWDSDRGYADRVANLRAGSGPILAVPGYKLQKGLNVLDDGDFDLLTGASGQDWFFFDLDEDDVEDKKDDEQAN